MPATRWARPNAPQGQVLFCNARPRSDLVIAPRSISKADPFARKTITARVFRLARLADDVMLVHLRFPAGIRVRFKAGQHLNLILDNGERRDFSMANPPRESDGVQLHIRHVPGGAFTGYVFNELKRGDHLRVEIPFGDFTLRESDKPILFVAGSTGFAPIKSMIEDMFIKGIERDMTLYWGARQRERALLRSAAKVGGASIRASSTCRCSPTSPEPGIRHDLVHRAVLAGPSLACRLPGLCLRRAGDDAGAPRSDFLAAGLPEDEFFADAFVTRAEVAARPPASSKSLTSR